MEQELKLQSSTEDGLAWANGPQAESILLVLRDQQARLGANVALLEQLYEMLPHPERFGVLRAKLAEARTNAAGPDPSAQLPELIAQHLRLLRHIEILVGEGLDGQRGELILRQVARSHQEMAWGLTALIKVDYTEQDRVIPPIVPMPAAAAAVERWENEGGGPDTPPMNSAQVGDAPAKGTTG